MASGPIGNLQSFPSVSRLLELLLAAALGAVGPVLAMTYWTRIDVENRIAAVTNQLASTGSIYLSTSSQCGPGAVWLGVVQFESHIPGPNKQQNSPGANASAQFSACQIGPKARDQTDFVTAPRP
jgi:hypothetical protein